LCGINYKAVNTKTILFILNKGISLTFFQYRNLPNREFYDKLDGS